MRELDEEEREILRILDSGISTRDLITIVRDLGDVLRQQGYVIQANVAELAADRLIYLNARLKALSAGPADYPS
ncbi:MULTISPECIES: hypothetical protein [Sphingobium]|jgi:hypothetical protein|uniref:hypothetical protein n=1 Tax=Sphingobium TaxID=165695 RepID=UPI0010F53F44|nr:hypothetical protein [Sphingobium sp. RSMS]UXC92938.1 hypothetical protein EGM87_21785 [Sphingobium sp. RSMS]